MAWGTKRLYFWMIDIWAIIPCSRSCRNYLKQQVRGGGGVGAAATLFDFFQRNPNQSQRSNIQDTCMILTFLVPLVLFLWTTPPGSGTASDTWELIYRVLLYIYRGESTRWYWYGGKRRKKSEFLDETWSTQKSFLLEKNLNSFFYADGRALRSPAHKWVFSNMSLLLSKII